MKDSFTHKPKRARFTIEDIARMAGVSRSTVSLAINNSDKINADTKAAILKLTDEVGYRPSAAARNLVQQSSGTICVILPERSRMVCDCDYYDSLHAALDGAAQRGFRLLVELATAQFKLRETCMEMYRRRSMDGVICIGGPGDQCSRCKLAEVRFPVVTVNTIVEGIPSVTGANRKAAFQVVEHLHKLGHRRIAHIRGREPGRVYTDRFDGYMDGLDVLGLDQSPELVVDGTCDMAGGSEAMKTLLALSSRPTAVFAANDMMAVGALKTIQEAGLRVPQDIALVGGDDSLVAKLVTPRLTTIHQSMYEINSTACDLLFKMINDNPVESQVRVPLELIVRESCGANAPEP